MGKRRVRMAVTVNLTLMIFDTTLIVRKKKKKKPGKVSLIPTQPC
jgi:hypothetical protein